MLSACLSQYSLSHMYTNHRLYMQLNIYFKIKLKSTSVCKVVNIIYKYSHDMSIFNIVASIAQILNLYSNKYSYSNLISISLFFTDFKIILWVHI